MFVVVDFIDRYLCFIDFEGNINVKVGYIELGFFGIIVCDKNNLVYLVSFNKDFVKVYNINVMCVRRIFLGEVLCIRSLFVFLDN